MTIKLRQQTHSVRTFIKQTGPLSENNPFPQTVLKKQIYTPHKLFISTVPSQHSERKLDIKTSHIQSAPRHVKDAASIQADKCPEEGAV